MRTPRRIAAFAAFATTAAVLAAAGSAAAATPRHDVDFHFGHADSAVFVQSDNAAGNTVTAYDRAPNGTLTAQATYPTGGLGGQLAGSAVDFTASEGSLAYDAEHGLLFAVNAGSNTVSVFAVHGTHLELRQVIGSGGTFPVSIAVRDNLVYVLNALGGGSVQGFFVGFDRLFTLPGDNRPLGLSPTATPQFVNTPGEVGFSPSGRQLVVTTKANGNDIDVFGVDRFGGLSATPVVNSEPARVPFGFTFDPAGNLQVAEAGAPQAVETFSLAPNGTVTSLGAVLTGQPATCWITGYGPYLYASNAGGPSISTLSIAPSLTLLATTTTDAGTVDATVSPDGRDLYVQTGKSGIVDEFSIGAGGALTPIGSVTVPAAAGGEGIAAS